MRLDETVTRANLQVVSKQLDEFLGRQSRLEAERDDAADIEVPEAFDARLEEPGVRKILDSERTLLKARRAAKESQKNQLEKRSRSRGTRSWACGRSRRPRRGSWS